MMAASGVIILFFIILAIAAIVLIAPIITRRLNIKVNLLIIGGYLAVLIVLSLVCLMLPGGALVKAGSLSSTIRSADCVNDLNNRISAGDFSAPAGMTKTEKSFKPQSGSIRITAQNCGAEILTFTKGDETPDNGDGKIDVYFYNRDNITVNGIRLSGNTKAPTIEYSWQDLKIKMEERQEINVYRFDDGYSARQFINTDDLDISSGCRNVIAVVIPDGVKIESTSTIDNSR
jgi:hypothetical protein